MPQKTRATAGWSSRSSASDGRLRGRKLQQLREELLRCNPYCAHCRRILSLSIMERDHIINLADGGKDDIENTQALCIDCHKAKTHTESNKARGITTKPRINAGCDVRGYPLSRSHHWNK